MDVAAEAKGCCKSASGAASPAGFFCAVQVSRVGNSEETGIGTQRAFAIVLYLLPHLGLLALSLLPLCLKFRVLVNLLLLGEKSFLLLLRASQ